MRRRDVLRMCLIVVSVPVGTSLVWEKTKTREDRIRESVHKRLLMCSESERERMMEAIPLVDDVLDLTFEIPVRGEVPVCLKDAGSVCWGDAEPYVKVINKHLEVLGVETLSSLEVGTICGVCTLIQENYGHRVSYDAMSVLLGVAVPAKVYQMRPDLPI